MNNVGHVTEENNCIFYYYLYYNSAQMYVRLFDTTKYNAYAVEHV